MKIITPERPLEISDDLEVKQFGISSSAKFYKILSDGLYSSKIRAVIRELSTNAYDSHVENGNPDKPFEVHLPIWTDRTFWIRDYGTGISPEKFSKLYTWYGESDRDQSNEFTGCQGLGSKTPFCYHSRCFNVESWWNGEHYLYSCFFNKQGIPSWTLIDEQKSQEPSGVKISFTTAQYDEGVFHREAKSIYQYFKVQPEINAVTLERPTYVLKGNRWALRDNSNSSFAIMGQVAYPIDLEESISPLVKNIIDSSFDIFFETGELDIETSREGLSYDNRTINSIKKKLREIGSEITQILENKIRGAKSLWEARCVFNKLYDTLPVDIFKTAQFDKIKWNGQVLFDGMGNHVKLNTLPTEFKLHVFRKNKWRSSIGCNFTHTIIPSTDIELYEIDLKTGYKGRAKDRCKEVDKDVYIASFPDSKVREDFLDTLGVNGEVDKVLKKVSTLPRVIQTTRGGSFREPTTEVMKFNPDGTSPTRYWINDKRKVSEGGIYVEWKKYRVKYKGKFIESAILSCIISHLTHAGVSIPIIYGIKVANIKEFNKSKKWTNFFKWAEEKLKEIEDKIDICQIINDKIIINELDRRNYLNNEVSYDLIEDISRCIVDTDINEFIDNVNTIRKGVKDWDKANSCIQLRLLLQLPKLEGDIIKRDIDQDLQKLRSKYRLFYIFRDRHLESVSNHILLYVNAVNGGVE